MNGRPDYFQRMTFYIGFDFDNFGMPSCLKYRKKVVYLDSTTFMATFLCTER